MSIDFEKWFSTINADFPMHFLERLDGEYCNPAARAMYDMYLRIKELEAETEKLLAGIQAMRVSTTSNEQFAARQALYTMERTLGESR